MRLVVLLTTIIRTLSASSRHSSVELFRYRSAPACVIDTIRTHRLTDRISCCRRRRLIPARIPSIARVILSDRLSAPHAV